jgi:hypothetical protein
MISKAVAKQIILSDGGKGKRKKGGMETTADTLKVKVGYPKVETGETTHSPRNNANKHPIL